MTATHTLGRLGIGTAALLLAAACGDGGSGGNTDIDPGQAAVVGGAAAGQIADMAADLATFGNPVGGFSGGVFAPSAFGGKVTRLMARNVPAGFSGHLALLADGDPNCVPTVSGDSADADGDGIQNAALYTFTAANCAYTDSLGNGFALTGSIGITDTDGGATLFGYSIVFNNWRVLFFTDSASAGFVYDGQYGATVTATTATATQDFSTRWRFNDNLVFAASYDWQVAYAPDTGTIDIGQPELPSGDFDINGAFGWSGDAAGADGDWSFVLSTPTDLHYNQGCATDPPLDAGQLRAAITGRSNVGFTVDYGPACGQETINTFDAGNS